MVRAFQDVQVEHFPRVKNAKVDGFTGLAPQRFKHRSSQLADGRLIRAVGAQPHQPGADEIRTRQITDQIALSFEVSEEAIGGALVQAGIFGNVTKLKPSRRTIEKIKDLENLREHPDRGGARSASFDLFEFRGLLSSHWLTTHED